MTIRPIPLSADRRRLADAFWRAAAICLALMPLVVVVADRSGPLLVTLAAASTAEGRARDLRREAARRRGTPLGAAALGFLAWAALSIAWSPVKAASLH